MASRRMASIRDAALWLLANAVVLALPLGLRADPAPPAAVTPLTVPRPDLPAGAARREANRAAILDARLEELHAGLKLTAAQDAYWPPVADAIRAIDKARGRRFRQQLEAAGNSIDGLKMQGDHMAKVGVAMSRLADATKPLVASLTPDQKSRLPALLQRVRPRKVMARAFELPADTEGGAQPRLGATAGMPVGPSPGATAGATGRSAAPPSGAAVKGPAAPSQPDDDDD